MRPMFSEAEEKVLEIIGNKKIAIVKITEKFYGDSFEDTFEPNNYVAAIVRRISKKCAFHKLGWTIDGEGWGRHGRKVWVARLK